jgi:hypothetical protein
MLHALDIPPVPCISSLPVPLVFAWPDRMLFPGKALGSQIPKAFVLLSHIYRNCLEIGEFIHSLLIRT